MPKPIEMINQTLIARQGFGAGMALLSNYDDQNIQNSSTYIHPDDMNLLTLAMKNALGIENIDSDRERVNNKTLYIAEDYKSAYGPASAQEIQRLAQNRNNQQVAAVLLKAINSLSSEKPRASLIMSSSSLDNQAQGRVHFINVNFELLANQKVTVQIEDSYGPFLRLVGGEDAVRAYEHRLQALFGELLKDKLERLSLNPLVLGQDSANCGIHALINKINFEHRLQLNPKQCVAPLRNAIAISYQDLPLAQITQQLNLIMQTLGLKGPEMPKPASPPKPAAVTPVLPKPVPSPKPAAVTPVMPKPVPSPKPAATPVMPKPVPSPKPAAVTPVVLKPVSPPKPAAATPVMPKPVSPPKPAAVTPVLPKPVSPPKPAATPVMPKPVSPPKPVAPKPEIPKPVDPAPEMPAPEIPKPEVPAQPINPSPRDKKGIGSFFKKVWEKIKAFFAKIASLFRSKKTDQTSVSPSPIQVKPSQRAIDHQILNSVNFSSPPKPLRQDEKQASKKKKSGV